MIKVGLEVHGYLLTEEKLFCTCKVSHGLKFAKPNINICPVCTAQPGAKPLLPNKTAVDKAVEIALILNCRINKKLIWQRKHYDWSDLPKGYQNTISGAYAAPLGEKGEFLGIKIRECHIEEDPAAWNPKTGEIDYNRSGSPLIEIVTEPDFKSSEEVVQWMKQLSATLGYIKAIDKNAGLKADVNISLPELGGSRVEIKNINSVKNIQKAIEYEKERQKKEIPKVQETRMFDETKGITKKMREKEQAQDYRFIAEPDLPVIGLEASMISRIKNKLPETPLEKLKKLIKKYNLDKKSAEVLIKNLEIVELFEKVAEKISPKIAFPWVAVEWLGVLNHNKKTMDEVSLVPLHMIELLNLIEKNKITPLKAKEILRKFIPESFSPIKEAEKHEKISSKEDLVEICKEVIKETPDAARDYKSGKKESLNFLIGKVMQKTSKRADFRTAKEVLEKLLK